MAAIRLIAAIPVVIIAVAWAFGAVWFDAPFGAWNRMAAALLATAFVVALLFVRPFWRKLVVFVVLFATVLTGGDTSPPAIAMEPDVPNAWADIKATVTFHNVQLRLRTDQLHPALGTRTVSGITGIDLAISASSPDASHRQLQFADDRRLLLDRDSQEVGQTYSTIAGLPQFELIYIVAKGVGVIRLRTNYPGDVYLYRRSPRRRAGSFLGITIRSTPSEHTAGITRSTSV
jgi:hypothetical protein